MCKSWKSAASQAALYQTITLDLVVPNKLLDTMVTTETDRPASCVRQRNLRL